MHLPRLFNWSESRTPRDGVTSTWLSLRKAFSCPSQSNFQPAPSFAIASSPARPREINCRGVQSFMPRPSGSLNPVSQNPSPAGRPKRRCGGLVTRAAVRVVAIVVILRNSSISNSHDLAPVLGDMGRLRRDRRDTGPTAVLKRATSADSRRTASTAINPLTTGHFTPLAIMRPSNAVPDRIQYATAMAGLDLSLIHRDYTATTYMRPSAKYGNVLSTSFLVIWLNIWNTSRPTAARKLS